MIRFVIGKDYGYKDGKQLVKAKLECDEIDELPAVNFFEGKLLDSGSQCWVIGTGDLYGLTSTGDWVKVNFMGNGEGGGGGGGFTPTGEQLTAMNSGITSTDVAQINTNKNDILSEQQKTTGMGTGGRNYLQVNGIKMYFDTTAPTGASVDDLWVGG